MEGSGYTLEEIAARDPEWIGRARALVARGRIELIGSGFSQMIGPLVPARVTVENLRLGHEIYARLLGTNPRLAHPAHRGGARAGTVPVRAVRAAGGPAAGRAKRRFRLVPVVIPC